MASDARISTGLPSHPKTKKLIRRLGPGAGWSLLCLILWARDNRPDGDLVGMSVEDVELACNWAGEADALVRELAAVGFLDGEDGSYALHDWADHQPWAAGSEARSEKSRWAALCRQHGRAEAARLMPEYAERLRLASHPHASGVPQAATGMPLAGSGTAPSPIPNPSPSPNPSPTKKTTSAPQGGLPGFDAFWMAWPTGDRKQARGKCLDAWKKAGAEPQAALVLGHVERMKASDAWTKDNGQFVPAPLVYLNQRRWEGADEGDPQQSLERGFV